MESKTGAETTIDVSHSDNSEIPHRKFFCVHKAIPFFSLANSILMAIPAGFILHDAVVTANEDCDSLNDQEINIIATTLLVLVIAVFQMFVSIATALDFRPDLKHWYASHIVFSVILAIASVYSFTNHIHTTYIGFTFTYTCILNSIFSLGLSIALMLPD